MTANHSIRLTLAFALAFAALRASAQDVKTAWTSMPQDMIPYLDASMKRELVDARNGNTAVKNLLGEESRLDTLTTDFMQVRLNHATTMQLKLLPTASGRHAVCVLRTVAAPARESVANIYDEQWKLTGQVDLHAIAKGMMHKPDTLSREKFEELTRQVNLTMPYALLSPRDNSLSVSLSTPLVDKDKKEAIRQTITQRNLKWNGVTFK